MGIILIVLIVAYSCRMKYVNDNSISAKNIVYEKETSVEFGENYVDSIDFFSNGYAIEVLDAELMDINSFYTKYQIGNGEEVDNSKIPYYFVVNVKVYNKTSNKGEMTGINLKDIGLVINNTCVMMDTGVFQMMYPNLSGSGFSLREGTDMDFVFAYPISEKIQKQVEKFKEKKLFYR